MKKLTTITAGLILFLGTSAFANWGGGEKKSKETKTTTAPASPAASTVVTDQVSKSFTAKFASAENVNWKQKEEFYFADFKVNQQSMFAAYNADGDLLGISRTVKLSQLPLHVEMSIRENYKNYKIDETVNEMVLDGETSYHLQVEDKNRYLKLKCDSDGQISVLKRTKKKLVGSVY